MLSRILLTLVCLFCRALALLAKAGLADARVLYVGESGAQLYGLESENEPDFVGIFVAPLRNVLGFARNRVARVDADGSVISMVNCKSVSHGRGMVLFELTHFAALFAGGNHRFMEQLYLKVERRFECGWWKEICLNLDLFLGKQAIEHYFGCLKGLMNQRGRAKLAERFLHACQVIICENRWPVEGLRDADRARINEMDANQTLSDLFHRRVEELEAAKKAHPLRNTTPGRDFVAEHCMKLRKLQSF